MKINVYGIRGFPNVQGGVEKHCEELYPRLASKGIGFKIFRRKPYVKNNQNFKYENIEFKDTWTIRNKYLETTIHSLKSAIETIKDRPDIVHIHNIGPAMTIPLLKIMGLKVIVTYHSPNYEHSKWNWFARLMLKISEKIILSFADKIIFISKTQKEKVSQKRLNTTYIPNGISSIKHLKPDISLSKFNLAKNELILTVGRLVPEKGFIDLLEAFTKVKTNLKLVIVGDYDNNPDYYNKLLKFKSKLNERLVFTGYLPSNDLKLLYENASFFVLPSENEGMPLALLEAISFGLFPLVSDIPQNLEVINDVNCGISFRCKDVQHLREKIDYMIKNVNGRRNEDIILNKYNWDEISTQTFKLYNEILNKDGKKL